MECAWMLVWIKDDHAGLKTKWAETIFDNWEKTGTDGTCVVRADEVEANWHIVIPVRAKNKTALKDAETAILNFQVKDNTGKKLTVVDRVKSIMVTNPHPSGKDDGKWKLKGEKSEGEDEAVPNNAWG